MHACRKDTDQLGDFLNNALMVTIFGYSAPPTDQLAYEIMKDAWKRDGSANLIKRVEIIDVRDREELDEQWASFSFFDHLEYRRSFYESYLAFHPRRSCEALVYSCAEGKYVEPIDWSGNREGLLKSIERLVEYEN